MKIYAPPPSSEKLLMARNGGIGDGGYLIFAWTSASSGSFKGQHDEGQQGSQL